MMERESWERFWVSGRIEDYLLYAGMAEKPESSAVDIPVIRDEVQISGKAHEADLKSGETPQKEEFNRKGMDYFL